MTLLLPSIFDLASGLVPGDVLGVGWQSALRLSPLIIGVLIANVIRQHSRVEPLNLLDRDMGLFQSGDNSMSEFVSDSAMENPDS